MKQPNEGVKICPLSSRYVQNYGLKTRNVGIWACLKYAQGIARRLNVNRRE
jgi:hypothetical protein